MHYLLGGRKGVGGSHVGVIQAPRAEELQLSGWYEFNSPARLTPGQIFPNDFKCLVTYANF